MKHLPPLPFWLLIILPLHCPISTFAQQAKAETEINEVIKEMDVVGLAVAVVKDGKLRYTRSFGMKDIASGTPLTNNDVFRIASISKSFTATAIMQLVEAHKLSLDDDISDLLGIKIRSPAFPTTVITLKMILSHTSGINDSQGYYTLDAINPAKNSNWVLCYNDYEPGTAWEYCNLNYNMAGAIIEKISGERFDQYVKHHILDPLGLYGGYCVDSLDSTRFATLYAYDSATGRLQPAPMAYAPRREEISHYTIGYSTPVLSPTGGMKISVEALANYMMMHMNKGKQNGKRIISKKSARLMQAKIAKEQGYALGLMNFDNLIPGKAMCGHSGSAYGLYSAMFFQSREKFGIVVITNGCKTGDTGEVHPLLKKVINILFRNLILPAS